MSFQGFARAHDFGRVQLSPQWLTWGAVAGLTAGELFRVGYTVTRPAVTGAQLKLADGRVLELTVDVDHLEVLLPPDTPAGWATITAQLEDAGGATDTATLLVLLVGITTTTTRSVPTLARRTRQHRLITSPPARAHVTAATGSLRRREPRRTTVVRLLPTVRRVRPAPIFRGRDAPLRVSLLAGRPTLHSERRTATVAVAVRAGATTVTHRDGPAIEEALLLELL